MTVLQSFLVNHSWTLWRSKGQLFHNMYLKLNLSSICLWSASGYAFLPRITRKWAFLVWSQARVLVWGVFQMWPLVTHQGSSSNLAIIFPFGDLKMSLIWHILNLWKSSSSSNLYLQLYNFSKLHFLQHLWIDSVNVIFYFPFDHIAFFL